MGQTRPVGVKSGQLVEIHQIYICFDSEFSQEFRFNIFQGQLGSSEVKLGSNLGQTGSKGVKSGRLVGIYQIHICFDSEFSQEFKFDIFQGQLWSSEVKLRSNSSNRGQIGSVDRNISNIHMFRLRIISRTQI